MKNIVIVFCLVLASLSVAAQDVVWKNNVNESIELSKKSNKPLMFFFTGSDWCGWCKRLQAEVFYKPEFSKWVADNVIPVEVDFPRGTPLAEAIKQQNNQLQQFFEVRGYPTVWFVNANLKDGKIVFDKLGSTGYVAGGPGAWLEVANGILKKK